MMPGQRRQRANSATILNFVAASLLLQQTVSAIAVDLSSYGYTTVWDAAQDGLLASPNFVSGSLIHNKDMDLGFSIHTELTTVEDCTWTCQQDSPSPGGTYFPASGVCHCHYNVECIMAPAFAWPKEGVIVFSNTNSIPPPCRASPCELYKGSKFELCRKVLTGQITNTEDYISRLRGRDSNGNEKFAEFYSTKEAPAMIYASEKTEDFTTKEPPVMIHLKEETQGLNLHQDERFYSLKNERNVDSPDIIDTEEIGSQTSMYDPNFTATDKNSIGVESFDESHISEIDTYVMGSSLSPFPPAGSYDISAELGLLKNNHTSATTRIVTLSPFTLAFQFQVPQSLFEDYEGHLLADLRGQQEDELLSQTRIHLQEYFEDQILHAVSSSEYLNVYQDPSLSKEDHQMAVVLSFSIKSSRYHNMRDLRRNIDQLNDLDANTSPVFQLRNRFLEQQPTHALTLERVMEGEVIFYNTSYAAPSVTSLDQMTREAFTKPIQRAMYVNLLSSGSTQYGNSAHAGELGLLKYLSGVNVTVWSSSNNTGLIFQEVTAFGETPAELQNITEGGLEDSSNLEPVSVDPLDEEEVELEKNKKNFYESKPESFKKEEEQKITTIFDSRLSTKVTTENAFPTALALSTTFVVGFFILLVLGLLLLRHRNNREVRKHAYQAAMVEDRTFNEQEQFVCITDEVYDVC